MSRIVLVSNRVSDLQTATQAGGVSVAIADIMLGREALWFGWNGEIVESTVVPALTTDEVAQSTIASTQLRDDEFRDFYLGYSNSVLWPVFHNRLDVAQFEAGYYEEYARVNQRFGEELAALVRPGDIIWVHDYQLIPMAKVLRRIGLKNPIGFFLHIPAPPAQAFLAIPESAELAYALAEYDLIGVQTEQDVANLIVFLQQVVGGRLLTDGRIRVGHRAVRLTRIPVGIDLREIVFEDVKPAEIADDVDFRIIGVDRLDYTKGLPQKFRAYDQFLAHNPDFRRRVVLTQIAPPTRETLEAYSDIRGELESLAGSINGRYSELDWAPISYLHRAIPRRELFAIYRNSRVGLVTPLQDGMNLVAKEYVASQDADNPGVLVLSRFAGAAEQLTEALIVNPYNIPEMAEAIAFAIAMPLAERRRRHERLMQSIAANDSNKWTETFLAQLVAASDVDAEAGEEAKLQAFMARFLGLETLVARH